MGNCSDGHLTGPSYDVFGNKIRNMSYNNYMPGYVETTRGVEVWLIEFSQQDTIGPT